MRPFKPTDPLHSTNHSNAVRPLCERKTSSPPRRSRASTWRPRGAFGNPFNVTFARCSPLRDVIVIHCTPLPTKAASPPRVFLCRARPRECGHAAPPPSPLHGHAPQLLHRLRRHLLRPPLRSHRLGLSFGDAIAQPRIIIITMFNRTVSASPSIHPSIHRSFFSPFVSNIIIIICRRACTRHASVQFGRQTW